MAWPSAPLFVTEDLRCAADLVHGPAPRVCVLRRGHGMRMRLRRAASRPSLSEPTEFAASPSGPAHAGPKGGGRRHTLRGGDPCPERRGTVHCAPAGYGDPPGPSHAGRSGGRRQTISPAPRRVSADRRASVERAPQGRRGTVGPMGPAAGAAPARRGTLEAGQGLRARRGTVSPGAGERRGTEARGGAPNGISARRRTEHPASLRDRRKSRTGKTGVCARGGRPGPPGLRFAVARARAGRTHSLKNIACEGRSVREAVTDQPMAVLQKPDFFFFAEDSPQGQPPGTTNRQRPTSKPANRQPLPTDINRQPPTANL